MFHDDDLHDFCSFITPKQGKCQTEQYFQAEGHDTTEFYNICQNLPPPVITDDFLHNISVLTTFIYQISQDLNDHDYMDPNWILTALNETPLIEYLQEVMSSEIYTLQVQYSIRLISNLAQLQEDFAFFLANHSFLDYFLYYLSSPDDNIDEETRKYLGWGIRRMLPHSIDSPSLTNQILQTFKNCFQESKHKLGNTLQCQLVTCFIRFSQCLTKTDCITLLSYYDHIVNEKNFLFITAALTKIMNLYNDLYIQVESTYQYISRLWELFLNIDKIHSREPHKLYDALLTTTSVFFRYCKDDDTQKKIVDLMNISMPNILSTENPVLKFDICKVTLEMTRMNLTYYISFTHDNSRSQFVYTALLSDMLKGGSINQAGVVLGCLKNFLKNYTSAYSYISLPDMLSCVASYMQCEDEGIAGLALKVFKKLLWTGCKETGLENALQEPEVFNDYVEMLENMLDQDTENYEKIEKILIFLKDNYHAYE